MLNKNLFKVIKSNSCQETISMGRRFGRILKEKDIVLLEGDLGGGKTTFVKGILEGLGYKRRVLSPSFTILRQYERRGLLINHLDFYRLGETEVFGLGLEEYLYMPCALTLIEWGQILEKYLPRYIKVKFDILKEESRKISFYLKGYRRSLKLK